MADDVASEWISDCEDEVQRLEEALTAFAAEAERYCRALGEIAHLRSPHAGREAVRIARAAVDRRAA